MHRKDVEARLRAPKGNGTSSRLWASAAVAALLTCPSAVAAATAPTTVEEIVVTGSLIRGTPPVGSSLISVGEAELKASTAPTVGEFLKNVPQVLGIGVDPGHKIGAGAGNVTYSSSINMRGLGPSATLVLYNGERMPRSGNGAFVDSSNIPGIAIQRIEVVADGASATYGSDAVAGVVNIITRKNVQGLELSATGGHASHMTDFDLGAIGGYHWTGGSAMLAADYVKSGRLRAADRDFAATANYVSRGGTDLRNTTCAPGTVVQAGVSYQLPNFTPGKNFCDTVQYNDILPELKRVTVLGEVQQQITDGVKLEVNGFFNRRNHNLHQATSSSRGGAPAAQTLTVPVTNAFYQTVPGVAPSTQTISEFIGGALGNTEVDAGPEEAMDLNANLKFDLPHSWLLTLDADYGHNWSKTFRAGINAAALQTALNSSNPATAFNPYNPALTPASVSAVINNFGNVIAWDRNTIEAYRAQVDGPLFNIPGGAVKVALGVEHRQEKNSVNSLTGTHENPVGSIFAPTRKVDSFYGELNAPIVSDQNAMPGIQRLTLSLALRHEKYSDFGKTSNPKLGLTWEPISDVTLHGSYGHSFRAPDLGTLAPIGPTSRVFILSGGPDPKNNGGPSTVAILSGGNPNLQPEKAKTYSVGVDLHPTVLPGFRASINYFNIKYSNVVVSLVTQNALAKEAQYPALFSRDPATIQARILAHIAKGALYSPGPPASFATVTALVDGTNQNSGITDLSGEDFDVNYHWSVDKIGDLDVGGVATYYNTYKVAASPAAPVIESVGTYSNPPRFRMRAHAGWRNGAFAADAYFNHTSAYADVAQKKTISAFDTIDLNGSVELGDVIDNEFTKGSKIILSVSNLFDKDPPFYNAYFGYDAQGASPIGRRVQIVLDKKF